MCLAVVFDDGETFPAWEAETCGELSRRTLPWQFGNSNVLYLNILAIHQAFIHDWFDIRTNVL